MKQLIKEFIEDNKQRNLYYFKDFDGEEYSADFSDLLSMVDSDDLENCQTLEELKDLLADQVSDFTNEVIIYHITALAYLSYCQAVDIQGDTLYEWANYELTDEVYNNLYKLF